MNNSMNPYDEYYRQFVNGLAGLADSRVAVWHPEISTSALLSAN